MFRPRAVGRASRPQVVRARPEQPEPVAPPPEPPRGVERARELLSPSSLHGLLGPGGPDEGDRREIIYESPAQAAELRRRFAVAKQPGHLLWPPHYPQIGRNLRAGRLDLSASTALLHGRTSASKPVIMIDGADELAQLLVSTGLRKRALATIQAMLFPPFMEPTRHGYVAAASGVLEATENVGALRALRVEQWNRTLFHLGALVDRVAERTGPTPTRPEEALVHALKSELRELRESPKPEKARALLAHLAASPRVRGVELELGIEHQHALERTETALGVEQSRVATSTLATVGTGGMWWAMAFFEASAVSQLLQLPNLSSALERVASALVPVGQATMALYGLASAAEGARVERELSTLRGVVERAGGQLDEATARTIDHQLSGLQTLNRVGALLGGSLLAAGQLAMLAGTMTGWGGARLLVAGTTGTLAGIGARIGADLVRSARFGYDSKAIDFDALRARSEPANTGTPVSDPPPGGGEEPRGRAAWVDAFTQIRTRSIEALAWLKVLTTLHALRARGPSSEPWVEALAREASRLSAREDEHELKGAFERIVEDAENAPLFDALGASEPALSARAALQLVPAVEAGRWTAAEKAALFTELRSAGETSASTRFQALSEALSASKLYGDVVEHVTHRAQLTRVAELEKSAPYFESTEIREKQGYELPFLWPEPRATEHGPRLGLTRARIPLGSTSKTVFMFDGDRLARALEAPIASEGALALADDFAAGAWKALDSSLSFRLRSRKTAAEVAMLYVLRREELAAALRSPPISDLPLPDRSIALA